MADVAAIRNQKRTKRMQLIRSILIFGLSLAAFLVSAQEGYQMKPNDKYVEVDFLSSYYSQDGNNGAVTGGIGTEQLTDFANILVVNVPLDSTKSINASAGVDIYSSASTDNIDSNPSSASSMDIRSYVNIGYTQKILKSGWTLGGRIGGSVEYDYSSINGGINLAKEFNNGNTELSFSGQAFVDNWKLYFPRELRGQVDVPTTSRNSYNAQLTWSQVINPRLQMSISAEAIYMEGLLSTPFHRVYFSDQALPDIERLPSSRLKIPLALRVNYKPTDKLTIRTYYRYYTDDFGIDGHTASIELPYHVNDAWTVAPFFRYHTQTGSDYFNPYAIANAGDQFYTSDFDLSELDSGKYGIGVGYTPLYGVGRVAVPFTKKIFMFNSITFRASRYVRSTGLDGYAFALGLNFRM